LGFKARQNYRSIFVPSTSRNFNILRRKELNGKVITFFLSHGNELDGRNVIRRTKNDVDKSIHGQILSGM